GRIFGRPERQGARHSDGGQADRSAATRRRDRVLVHAEGVTSPEARAQKSPRPDVGGSSLWQQAGSLPADLDAASAAGSLAARAARADAVRDELHPERILAFVVRRDARAP